MPRRLQATIPTLVVLLLALVLVPATRAAPTGGRLVPAFQGHKFSHPLGLVNAGDGSGTLYVLEQGGTVQAVAPSGQVRPFLDLTAKAYSKQQGGLLGLAFHPQYAQNGRFFVDYVTQRSDKDLPFEIVVSEFRAQNGVAQPGSERVLVEIPKSLALHNGGTLVFGPDGMLYISTGDNAIQKQAVNTAQSPASLLGKILRIDVDHQAPPLAYAIPSDNPWANAGQGVRPEIWAYGLRNPWRMSFDAQGRLWVGDPGSNGPCHEVIRIIQKGGNHGWPFYEGTRTVEPIPPALQGRVNPVPPAFEYVRKEGEGSTSAIGGYVYRGSQIPGLKGRYVFGDYGRGQVMSIQVTGNRGSDMQVIGPVPQIASLGEDEQGELYACAIDEGIVYKLVP